MDLCHVKSFISSRPYNKMLKNLCLDFKYVNNKYRLKPRFVVK